jgi:hypothetical protein
VAVAGVTDPGKGQAFADTVFADPPFPEKLGVGADQAVVVERRHDRYARIVGGLERRGRDQGKGVVKVDDFRPVLANRAGDSLCRAAGPHRCGEEAGAVSEGEPVGDLVVVEYERRDIVTGVSEQPGIGLEGDIFAATFTVILMDEEDAH